VRRDTIFFLHFTSMPGVQGEKMRGERNQEILCLSTRGGVEDGAHISQTQEQREGLPVKALSPVPPVIQANTKIKFHFCILSPMHAPRSLGKYVMHQVKSGRKVLNSTWEPRRCTAKPLSRYPVKPPSEEHTEHKL
jgi:hypothetical protein